MTNEGESAAENQANPFSSPVETPPEPERGIGILMGMLIAFVSLGCGVVAFGCSCYPLAVAATSVANSTGFFIAIGGSLLISTVVIFLVARWLVRSERKARASKAAHRQKRC